LIKPYHSVTSTTAWPPIPAQAFNAFNGSVPLNGKKPFFFSAGVSV
jgi:hypothetical protein